jgi:hypothetical protein
MKATKNSFKACRGGRISKKLWLPTVRRPATDATTDSLRGEKGKMNPKVPCFGNPNTKDL